MMKSSLRHIVLLLILLTACGKERQPAVPVPSDTPIEFRKPQTKGQHPLEYLEQLAQQHFGVSAWYTPEGGVFDASSELYIANHQFGTLITGNDLTEDDYRNATWQGTAGEGDSETADPVYYPLDGTLSYFCYAPYRENVGSTSDVQIIYDPDSGITSQLSHYLPGSPLIRFTPMTSAADMIDFIAGIPVLDKHRDSGAIALDLSNHPTTALQFYVKYVGALDPSEGVVITQIVIRNVIGSEYLYFTQRDGNYGFEWCSTISPDPSSATMPRATYTLFTADLKNDFLDSVTPLYVNETLNGRLYLLPQVLPEESYLDITYNVKNRSGGSVLDENVVSIPLHGTVAWPQGKKVKYTITITVADRCDVSIDTITIDNWMDAENTHPSTELMY